ncbi:MAG: tetratricopeptide repeat protein [candidate division KSB1 bacterium]|nr:tetratricopeptide repeat protein [candidate division KSB1 bacterium]MDZ7303418.1 tetratricopeptide repeat protein [candidate division KSB1 bacterium]MDZ7312500.1 tetratricopeptide repeat protein [candidate division KSB1 bacterium]
MKFLCERSGLDFVAWRLVFFSMVLCFSQPLASQSLFQNLASSARITGLGGPHLLGPADATNTLWNPSTLASLREIEFLLNSNQPFEFSSVGLAGYWPSIGSFGLHLARFPITGSCWERASAAWAHSLGNVFSFGISLHGNRLGQDEFATTSIGMVWHPLGARLPLSRDPYQASFFNVPLTPYPLAFAVQASDLPLGRERLSRFYVAGAAARFTTRGPALLASLETSEQKMLTRLGLASPIIQHVAVYGGITDFEPKNTAVGLTLMGTSYSFDVAYCFAEKRFLSGIAFRLGQKAGDRANRHLTRGTMLAKSANYRQALRQFKHYFAYESENPKARQIAGALANQVRKDDEKIRKLMDEAALQKKKFKYVDAAVIYLAVLQINNEYEEARRQLSQLQPGLDLYLQRKYNEGKQLFEEGNYPQAKKVFESILLLRKSYANARDYLARINEVQQKAAEDAYFRGLGYFSQRNFSKALEFFQNALSLSPHYEEAQIYLDKTQAALQRQKEKIARLLVEANRLNQQQQFNNAYRAYREVLELDPENETAKQQIRLLQSRIDAFINEKLQAANRALDGGDYNQASALSQQILDVYPRHDGATAVLQRLAQINNKRAEEFVRRGLNYFEAKNWNRAVAEFDKALSFDPKNKVAQQKREEALSQSDIQQLFDQAQEYFSQNQFLQAMEFYKTILVRDPHNSIARARLEECQRQLDLQVEIYFKRGLSFYAAEDYEGAIREWEKVLSLNPTHKQSLEYKQSAQQRLDALKRLQE